MNTKRVDNRPITSKQSAFADEWVRNGNNATLAYSLAYDTSKHKIATIERNASKLLRNNKVATRIEQRTRALAKRVDITLDDTVQLQWGIAKDNYQPGNVRSQAGMNAAKLLGYFIERKEIHTTSDEAEIELRAALKAGSVTLDQLRAHAGSAPIVDVTPTEALPEPHTED